MTSVPCIGKASRCLAALAGAVFFLMAFAPVEAADSVAGRLQAIVDGDHRSAQHRDRDDDRHPVETLTFFGIEPDMTVVELWPFGGWYTEILAPFLKDDGKLYATILDASEVPGFKRYNGNFRARMQGFPDLYDQVTVTEFSPDSDGDIAPPGTADMVLSFRHMHEWAWFGVSRDILEKAYRALKPGGVLGLVEHRAKDPEFVPPRGKGYVGEKYAIELVESVGFELVAKSDVNNNPKDTKDYLRGIWMLPPNLYMPKEYRQKYEKIGEPDRFTVKFVKPAE